MDIISIVIDNKLLFKKLVIASLNPIEQNLIAENLILKINFEVYFFMYVSFSWQR